MSRLLAPLSFLIAVLVVGCASAPTKSEKSVTTREVRGVWITNVDSDVLSSRAKIAEAMDFLSDHNFNVVYPVVWNGGHTLYPSEVMEELRGSKISPVYEGRDPLAELIVEAHRVGLEVIPWFEYGFAASYDDETGGELLRLKPEWASLDSEGHIATKNKFQWMDSLNPEVQRFISSLVLEVAENYDIDGIQGDDRLPAMPSLGGYSPKTITRYREARGQDAPIGEKDPEWVQWRADLLTDFLAELRRQVKDISPDLIVSMSPSYYDWALFEYLQDSKTWTERGLVDALHPQAYRYSFEEYRKVIDDIVDNQFTADTMDILAPGILIKLGSYRMDSAFLLQCIAYNRSRNVNGEILFFYEGLRENGNELSKALLRGPYSKPAALPWRSEVWRPRAGVYTAKDSVYTVSVESAGDYEIYVKLPTDSPSGPAVYRVRNADKTRTKAMRLDQSGATKSDQWVRMGTMKLYPDTEYSVTVAPDPGSKEPIAVGELMLLRDRTAGGTTGL